MSEIVGLADRALADVIDFFKAVRARAAWSTYGVFLEPRAARGFRSTVADGTARVLVCQEALARRAAGDAAWARTLTTCTLIHEHLHAAVWHARVTRGVDPKRLDRAQRQAIDAAEEAFATWLELRHARAHGEPRLISTIEAYIASGTWPDWPYAGAAVIDRLAGAAGAADFGATFFRRLAVDPLSAVAQLASPTRAS